jgi:hypothetical protein
MAVTEDARRDPRSLLGSVDAFLHPHPSRWTVHFDMAFGIAAPALVLYLDQNLPVTQVFSQFPLELLPYRPFTPLLAAACMIALAAWYPFRERPGRGQAFAAGALACGAAYAGSVGAVLLPFALIGLLIHGIGLLGLVPLATAFVFARSVRRAWKAATVPAAPRLALALAGAVVVLLASLGISRVVESAERRATAVVLGREAGDPASAERTLRLLRAFPGVGLRQLRRAAYKEMRSGAGERRARDAFQRVTGRDLAAEVD